MKTIVCEMCGGRDLVKQDGVFVCQNCGAKYEPEEAKKLMVGVSAEEKEKDTTVRTLLNKNNKRFLVIAGITLIALVVILVIVFSGSAKTPLDKLWDCPDLTTTLKRYGKPDKEVTNTSYDLVLRYYDYEWLNYKGELNIAFDTGYTRDELDTAYWICETTDLEKAFTEMCENLVKKFGDPDHSNSTHRVWKTGNGHEYRLYIYHDVYTREAEEIWFVFD